MFVARQRELAQLEAFLNRALDGQGGVCFVAGEPGSGKTTLTQEFIRRSQEAHTDLIAAIGNCNAQTGIGEAYLPFREVLGLLTGDLEAKLAQGAITTEGANRLQKILARSGLLLLEVGPDLVGAFLPGGKIVATLGKAMAKQVGWDTKLTATVQQQPIKGAPTQASVEQDHIFEQFTNFLIKFAAEHPLLIVLDDLQWADASSMSLLFHIGRRIGQSRVLIVGAYRSDEIVLGREDASHPLGKVLAEFKRLFGEIEIELGQGDEGAERSFVDACVDAEPNRLGYDFRQALAQRTGGNPLFIVELLGYMREHEQLVKNPEGEWCAAASVDWTVLPARVEGVIEERLLRLGKEGRDTLAVGSVEGQSFTAEVIAQIRKTDDREIVRRLSTEMSKQHHLVGAAGVERAGSRRLSHYQFRHNLFQKYLYEGLDEIERSYLHEDVGYTLELFYESRLDDVAVQLARHFSIAGLDEKAARYHRRAGELAAARYAHDEAVQHFSQALALTPATDAAARCQLLLAREAVYNWQGKRTAQADDLAALAVLVAQMNDRRVQAEVSLRRASYARRTGDYQAAQAQGLEAVMCAEQAGDRAVEAQGYALLGLVSRNVGNYKEAQGWLEMALDLARDLNDPNLTAQTTYFLGLNQFSLDHYVRAQQHIEAAQAVYRAIASSQGEANCLTLLGGMQTRQGNYGSAVDYLRQGLDACRRIGWRAREAAILGDLGTTLFDVGDYKAARSHHLQALEIARDVGDRASQAVSLDTLGLVYHYLSQNADALSSFRQALSLQREIRDSRGQGYTLTHLGYALADGGDLSAAKDAFSQALSVRQELDADSGVAMDDLAGLARVALAAGDLAQATTHVEGILAWIEANGADRIEYPVFVYLICYQVLEACARQRPDERARARAVLQQAVALLQRRAAAITDPGLRQQFLENVPSNRELMAASAAGAL